MFGPVRFGGSAVWFGSVRWCGSSTRCLWLVRPWSCSVCRHQACTKPRLALVVCLKMSLAYGSVAILASSYTVAHHRSGHITMDARSVVGSSCAGSETRIDGNGSDSMVVALRGLGSDCILPYNDPVPGLIFVGVARCGMCRHASNEPNPIFSMPSDAGANCARGLTVWANGHNRSPSAKRIWQVPWRRRQSSFRLSGCLST